MCSASRGAQPVHGHGGVVPLAAPAAPPARAAAQVRLRRARGRAPHVAGLAGQVPARHAAADGAAPVRRRHVDADDVRLAGPPADGADERFETFTDCRMFSVFFFVFVSVLPVMLAPLRIVAVMLMHRCRF